MDVINFQTGERYLEMSKMFAERADFILSDKRNQLRSLILFSTAPVIHDGKMDLQSVCRIQGNFAVAALSMAKAILDERNENFFKTVKDIVDSYRSDGVYYNSVKDSVAQEMKRCITPNPDEL